MKKLTPYVLILILLFTGVVTAQEFEELNQAIAECPLARDAAVFADAFARWDELQILTETPPTTPEELDVIVTLYQGWQDLRTQLPDCAGALKLDQILTNGYADLLIAGYVNLTAPESTNVADVTQPPEDPPTNVAVDVSSGEGMPFYVAINANVRACPFLDCRLITILPVGAEVPITALVSGAVVSETDLWGATTSNGETGYVHMSLLTEDPPLVPPPRSSSATTTASTASAASTTSTVASDGLVTGSWTLFFASTAELRCTGAESQIFDTNAIVRDLAVPAVLNEDASAFVWSDATLNRIENGNFAGVFNADAGSATIVLSPVDNRNMNGAFAFTVPAEDTTCDVSINVSASKD